MPSIPIILKTRFIQLKRMFLELGFVYLLLFLAVAFVLGTQFLPLFDSPWLVAFISFQIILSIHLTRKDKQFLESIFPDSKQIYWAEYGLLSFPTLVILLFKLEWIIFLIYLLAVFFIPFIRFSIKVSRTKLLFPTSWLAESNFEWRSGMKKAGWMMLFLHIVSVVCMPYGLKFAWLLGGVGSLFAMIGFYTKFEPRTFLEATGVKPKQFLWRKIKTHYWSLLISFAPVLVCQAVFYPKSIVFIIPFLLVAFMILSALIITKYASYEPNSEVGSAFQIIYGIFVGGIILPIFLFVPLFFIVRKYPRAVENLEEYL
jgi:hypothetical protein